MLDIRYLEKKLAKCTFDLSAYRTEASAFTFDAAEIDEAVEAITIKNHPYKMGDLVSPVLTAATGVTATAPAIGTAYYIIYVNKDTVALATSLANAKAGTRVVLTAGGATDVYLQKNCFGAVGTGLIIPKGAIITDMFYDVITTLKSWDGAWGAGNEDLATVALSLLAANDLVSAVTIADAGNVWDAGIKGTLYGSPALGSNAATLDSGTSILYAKERAAVLKKMTADTELVATIGVDPISQGKIDFYVEYFI